MERSKRKIFIILPTYLPTLGCVAFAFPFSCVPLVVFRSLNIGLGSFSCFWKQELPSKIVGLASHMLRLIIQLESG